MNDIKPQNGAHVNGTYILYRPDEIFHIRVSASNGTLHLIYFMKMSLNWSWYFIWKSQIASFMSPNGAHLGPVGPGLAPSWPHETCYQGMPLSWNASWFTGGNRAKLPSSRWRRRGRSLREVFVCSRLFATTDLSQIYNREARRHGTHCTKTTDSYPFSSLYNNPRNIRRETTVG